MHDHAHGPHPHDRDGHAHGAPGHAPSHVHSHAHAPADFGTAFALGIALNTGFVAVEAVYGWLSNSMALVADAGHNLSDVLGLAAAWIAAVLVRRSPSARYTYGLRGSSILAALFNAVFLLVATGGIIVEALRRLAEPAPVAGATVMAVAAVGIAVNGVTAWLFASGRHGDLNVRGAYLHMAADAAVSAGVVLAGLAVLGTGWSWIDPAVGLAVAALIIAATWGLLRDSVAMALDAVPPGIDPAAVRACLDARPGVSGLHDLHIWSLSMTEVALTAHLVMTGEPAARPDGAFLRETAEELRARFGIAHATLQLEAAGGRDCTLPAACAA